jgi:nucleoside-diphosphate-sugar epimerase
MGIYLVTGGAGFIGSHIAQTLADRGETVRVLDNFLTGKKENLSSFRGKIELLEGDIRDFETCRRASRGADYILHQAALPSVPRSVENPLLANEINVTGTLNVLLAARQAKVKRVVFASSSSVYGEDPRLPKREGMVGHPLSPYAVTKLAGENYCRVFNLIYGLSTVGLRYFNVFGPRQDPYSQYAAVIPNFILKILKGESPTVYGDGEQSRDFTYVSDIVEANLLAATAEGVSGEVFNIACGQKTTINRLVQEINGILGTRINPVHRDARPADVRHSLADISRAQESIRYRPRFSFRQGLEQTIDAFRKGD